MVFRPTVDQQLCFVLMPFGEPFDDYYDNIISPAIESAGLNALRADKIYGAKPIVRDIWEAIWRCRLVVADVTGRNPNVNYELGLCHALGIPTVLITKDLADVPFDYRHRRCIEYKTEKSGWDELLRADLENNIKATLQMEPWDGDLEHTLAYVYMKRVPAPGIAYVAACTSSSDRMRKWHPARSRLRPSYYPHALYVEHDRRLSFTTTCADGRWKVEPSLRSRRRNQRERY